MAKRGPAPTPTKLKIVRGNPGRRRLNTAEPEPAASAKVPKAPEFLDKFAAAEWNRVAPQLHGMGLLTVVDETPLVVYCRAVSTHRRAEDWIDAHDLTVGLVTQDGRTRGVLAVPQVAISRGAAKIIKEFAAEFGFTPAARSRIQVPNKKPAAKGKARFFGATG